MITIGLAAINVGAIASDGGMGTTLAPLGVTFRDTCQITQEDGEVTELFSEENDDPEHVITRPGKIKVNFSVMKPDVDTLAKMLGGSVSSSTWDAPGAMPEVERSVEIVPKQGLKISIPRLKMDCKIDWSNVGTTPLLITVSGTVLVPTKSGVSKISAVEV